MDNNTKYIVFFDTETNGLPKKRNVDYNTPNMYPELVSIAWQKYELKSSCEKICISNEYFIIKPDNYKITKGIEFHKITNEKAMKEGVSLKYALDKFKNDIQGAYVIAAHNLDFDKNVILSSFKHKLKYDVSFWDTEAEHCTMKFEQSEKSEKYIKLDDLYFKTFKKHPPINAHNAIRDVEVLKDIFFATCNVY